MALDERTPLLPPLNAGENHVGRAMGQIEFDVEDRATALRKLDTWTPETLDEFIPQDLSYSDRTAFSLILLSRALCSDASRNCESSQSNTRSANLDALNKTLLLVTDLLAKYEANCVSDNQNVIDSFEKLLTTQFTGASDKSYRVLDAVCQPLLFKTLLQTKHTFHAILHLWSKPLHGRYPRDFRQLYARALEPRSIYAVAVLSHLLYLYLLLRSSVEYWGLTDELRAIFIAILAFSQGVLAISSSSWLAYTLALIYSLTQLLDIRETLLFLQWAIVLHISQVYVISEQSASPIALLSPHDVIPLTIMVSDAVSKAIAPATLLFFPILIVSSYMISELLRGPGFSTLRSLLLEPPPSGYLYLSLSAMSIILIWALSWSLIINTASVGSSTELTSWDVYGQHLGFRARLRFAQLVAFWHRDPPIIPAPFNLVEWILVALPARLGVSRPTVRRIHKAVWHATVLPFSAIMAIALHLLPPTCED